MYLIQILLPLYDNEKRAIPQSLFSRVQQELTERFGGVTAHLRSPALGRWKDPEGEVDHDQVVGIEVMAEALDRAWWTAYRRRLEEDFRQEKIIVRAIKVEEL